MSDTQSVMFPAEPKTLLKRCCTCHEVKPYGEFHKSPGEKDRYHARCKVCCTVDRAKRRLEGQIKDKVAALPLQGIERREIDTG